ncbi:nucleoid occlusion protein [Oceanobacillus caeni]|uniref:Nucleoid occlusion protein n=1 Tax=Oceanobacillus caeni TaxID=405946 RepID=A0ABR5MIE7_9BACI|nr:MULTISPECIES: nucleoid occlusion protein [Bacillaceae]KKE77534.1 chromosome partitioning protein ParB [Bacilli bacterium VT-13-104]PZD86982.1 nucleoid occlusion protein [Bacilli bacterium]KPH74046.1 chromosome partitioning protein ParB [Oceanobacillus caeni]MBU8790869.1 nucleoid occlusion protein [Oceanobacillus caeni]MCR1834436.1 nucleoid occlusion protein [Oceanobacillus caeni]
MVHPFNRFFGLGDKTSSKDIDEESYQSDEVIQLPVKDIIPNRYQPRSIFDNEKIQELAQTIHTHGMIQPIVVRKYENDQYEIIAGERRWRAVQSLGWETISAIVREMTDTETASVALIENLQREELTVIEEAFAYSKLLEMHSLTQEALAQRLGKNQSTIANKLRLLKLPKEVQDALLNKLITERHARALIKLKDEEKQNKILQIIIENELNVKQTEERVAKMQEPKEPKKKRPKLKGINKDIRIAMNTIRQSLSMVTKTGVDVESDEKEFDEYYQITVKIPKKK